MWTFFKLIYLGVSVLRNLFNTYAPNEYWGGNVCFGKKEGKGGRDLGMLSKGRVLTWYILTDRFKLIPRSSSA